MTTVENIGLLEVKGYRACPARVRRGRTIPRPIIIFFAISFLAVLPIVCSGQKLQAPIGSAPLGYVSDYAGVIDEASKTQMERILASLKEKTGAEVAVVTVDTMAPYATIEEFTIELATKWGVGKRGEDNGVLIALAIQERKTRIEVGYGLEGIIPDGLAGQILDQSMLPSLRAGEYGPGLLKGVEAVAGIIAKEKGVDLGPYNLGESRQYTRTSSPGLGMIIFIIILFVFIGGRRFLWPLLFLGGMTSGRISRGGFGSGGSGFGGSGFSGFGGGSFGGGGSSRGF